MDEITIHQAKTKTIKQVLDIEEVNINTNKIMTQEIFSIFDYILRQGLENGDWGLCQDIDDVEQYFAGDVTFPDKRLEGMWVYIYTGNEDYNGPLTESVLRILPNPDRILTCQETLAKEYDTKLLLWKL